MSAGASAVAATPARAFVLLHGFAQKGGSWDEAAAILRAQGHVVHAPNLMDFVSRSEVELLREWLAANRKGSPASPPQGEAACRARGNASATSGCMHDHAMRLLSYCEDVCQRHGRKPVLVGYSMGGRLALEAACLVQSEASAALRGVPFSGLVLESVGLGPADAGGRERFFERNVGWADRVLSDGVASFMDWWETLPLFASQHDAPSQKQALQRASRLDNRADELAFQLVAWGQHNQAPQSEALACLRNLAEAGVPIAYFAGERDAKYCAAAQLVRENVSRATVRTFPGVGHNVHWEAPRVFAEALGELVSC